MSGNLVLTRKINESIIIGDDIKITVVNIGKGRVRLGIKAPDTVTVHREEVYNEIVREERGAKGVFE
tara:strand:+ start:1039 stop:1239 length:201 start_codon:yes stop_codon:yes gene_type:complete